MQEEISFAEHKAACNIALDKQALYSLTQARGSSPVIVLAYDARLFLKDDNSNDNSSRRSFLHLNSSVNAAFRARVIDVPER